MFELNRENLSLSSQVFLDNTGHNIIDLLNNILREKSDLEQLIKENGVEKLSQQLPGLIVQGSSKPIFESQKHQVVITNPDSAIISYPGAAF